MHAKQNAEQVVSTGAFTVAMIDVEEHVMAPVWVLHLIVVVIVSQRKTQYQKMNKRWKHQKKG